MNRLEDSLLLWKSVVTNKLLANVDIILFLNKCDLLQVSLWLFPHSSYLRTSQAKLDAGVRLNEHMISYGDRPNDYDSVSKCTSRRFTLIIFLMFPIDFRNKFGALHQSYTPNRERELYSNVVVVRLIHPLTLS